MKDRVDQKCVIVDVGDFGLHLFNVEVVRLGDDGIARNLEFGTAYAVLDADESEAYMRGEVEMGMHEDDPAVFTLMFPSLGSLKTSIRAGMEIGQ